MNPVNAPSTRHTVLTGALVAALNHSDGVLTYLNDLAPGLAAPSRAPPDLGSRPARTCPA